MRPIFTDGFPAAIPVNWNDGRANDFWLGLSEKPPQQCPPRDLIEADL
jgi:hypothetical protein